MEAAADEPLDCGQRASEVIESERDRIAPCTQTPRLYCERDNASTVGASSKLVEVSLNRMDKRPSYNKPFDDLIACKKSDQEQEAHGCPRLQDEMQVLFTCPTAFHAEAIENILMHGMSHL